MQTTDVSDNEQRRVCYNIHYSRFSPPPPPPPTIYLYYNNELNLCEEMEDLRIPS